MCCARFVFFVVDHNNKLPTKKKTFRLLCRRSANGSAKESNFFSVFFQPLCVPMSSGVWYSHWAREPMCAVDLVPLSIVVFILRLIIAIIIIISIPLTRIIRRHCCLPRRRCWTISNEFPFYRRKKRDVARGKESHAKKIQIFDAIKIFAIKFSILSSSAVWIS